jgi:hypothetical protein
MTAEIIRFDNRQRIVTDAQLRAYLQDMHRGVMRQIEFLGSMADVMFPPKPDPMPVKKPAKRPAKRT